MGQQVTVCPELIIQNWVLSESSTHKDGCAQHSTMSGSSVMGSPLWTATLKRKRRKKKMEPGL